MEPQGVQTQVVAVVEPAAMLATMAAMEAVALSSLDTHPHSEQSAALFTHIPYAELFILPMCLLHRAYYQSQQFQHHRLQLNT
jgi:hypothetical protein